MYILFDIGGTKTRIAKSEDGKSIAGEIIKIDTPKNFELGVSLLSQTAKDLSGGKKITAMGGGIAGPLNKRKTALANSPNLPDWINKPLAEELGNNLNAPIVLENDAAVVGLGEALYGAGQGFDIVAYLTISTGVGGARIVNKKIDGNTYGFEPGHQIIAADGPDCPICGAPGHLETFVSGRGLKTRYDKDPEEITDLKIWEKVATYLAYGLNNTIVHWSPAVVVLGGSIINNVDNLFEMTASKLREMGRIFPEIPEIKKSTLEDNGGIHGALALLSQND